MLVEFIFDPVNDLLHGQVSIGLSFQATLMVSYLLLQDQYLLLLLPYAMQAVLTHVLLRFQVGLKYCYLLFLLLQALLVLGIELAQPLDLLDYVSLHPLNHRGLLLELVPKFPELVVLPEVAVGEAEAPQSLLQLRDLPLQAVMLRFFQEEELFKVGMLGSLGGDGLADQVVIPLQGVVSDLKRLEFEALEVDRLPLEVQELPIGGRHFPQLTELEVRVKVDQLQVVLGV